MPEQEAAFWIRNMKIPGCTGDRATDEAFCLADLIVKAKEYLPQEYHYCVRIS